MLFWHIWMKLYSSTFIINKVPVVRQQILVEVVSFAELPDSSSQNTCERENY